jgi:hypothetical protein
LFLKKEKGGGSKAVSRLSVEFRLLAGCLAYLREEEQERLSLSC